jgi:hypothetical protein
MSGWIEEYIRVTDAKGFRTGFLIGYCVGIISFFMSILIDIDVGAIR